MSRDPLDPPTIDEDYERRVAEAEEEERIVTLNGRFCGIEWEGSGDDLILSISVPMEEGERLAAFFNGPALVTLEQRE